MQRPIPTICEAENSSRYSARSPISSVARRMFAKAVELDPRYVHAYDGIGVLRLLLKSQYGVRTPAEKISGKHGQGAWRSIPILRKHTRRTALP